MSKIFKCSLFLIIGYPHQSECQNTIEVSDVKEEAYMKMNGAGWRKNGKGSYFGYFCPEHAENNQFYVKPTPPQEKLMTPDAKNLLPCPFCGSNAIKITTRHTTRCELLTDCAGGMNEVPVEYWENRATPTPQQPLEISSDEAIKINNKLNGESV